MESGPRVVQTVLGDFVGAAVAFSTGTQHVADLN